MADTNVKKICPECGGPGPFSESLRTKDKLNRICDSCLYVFSEKTCPKCHKSGLFFGKSNTTKDGMNCYCVVCWREAGRKHREEHKEEVAEKQKQWKEAHPDKSAQYAKANYARRKEECRKDRREYYANNKEQMNKRIRANYYLNREERLKQIAVWRLSNPEKLFFGCLLIVVIE